MWKELRRLVVAAPEDRWEWDLFFVPVAVFVGVWAARSWDSKILGLAVVAVIVAIRQVLFRYFVKSRRQK